VRGNKSILILIPLVCLSAFRWDSAPQKVREGNRLFEKKEYGEALARYRDAQGSRPNAPEIPFNMGDSFYRQKEYKEAIASHERAIALASGALSAKTHYNIGNSLYREGDLEKALESYKKAIDMDPDDLDTKYNIELIQRQMKEQESKSEQKEEEKSQGSAQQKTEDKNQKENENTPTPTPNEISKKDAERLLSALQSQEKSLSSPKKEVGKRNTESPVEKDW